MENNHLAHHLEELVQTIVNAIKQRLRGLTSPLIVSLDGGSGAGKSVLASEVASSIGATVIQCDAFFNTKIPDKAWDTYSIEERCRLCIDWNRLRNEALIPLLGGEKATYRPFSFSTTSGLSSRVLVKEPSQIIILDGIYSSYWLSDLVHLKVLVDVPSDVRYKRHNLREGTEDIEWHGLWDPVEDYYFTVLRPPNTFDLVVVNE